VRSSRRFYTGFLVPGNAIQLLLFLVPLAAVVAFSFGTLDVVGRPQLGFTWDNYSQVLQPYYVPIVLRTIGFAAATTAICLALGYPLAYVATRFAGRWGPIIVALIVLTWLVDYLVRIYAWTALLGDSGLINGLLGHAGIGPLHMLGSNGAVITGLVYVYFPLMVLPIYAALGDLNPALIEAGKDLYGGPRQTFWHVTLPATRAGVIGGVLLVFLPALGDFATAQFLGGPQSAMIGNLINQQFTNSGSVTFGSALTVVLLIILLIGVGLAALFLRRGFSRAVAGPAA
jgi:spermidine/putrescine transport system permease protein